MGQHSVDHIVDGPAILERSERWRDRRQSLVGSVEAIDPKTLSVDVIHPRTENP